MPRTRTIALVLVVALAVGVSGFVAATQLTQSPPEVRSVELLGSECDDSSYQSATELRPTDGGTEIVVEDVFVGPSPSHGLNASIRDDSGEYVLTLTPVETGDSRDCTGELHYRVVVFVPAENFYFSVVHGDETHTSVHSGSDGSSASSGSESSDSSESPGSASESSASD